MLEPGKTAPLIKGGTPICSYECGGYRAILAKDPESFGPMKYPHVLIVFKGVDNTPPIMFITAEQSTISSALLEMVPEELKAKMGEDAGKGVFLGVFDENGHSNLGSSEEYAILDKFEKKALAVMRNRLNLTACVQVINDTRKGGKFGGNGCMSVIAIFGVVSYGIYGATSFFMS